MIVVFPSLLNVFFFIRNDDFVPLWNPWFASVFPRTRTTTRKRTQTTKTMIFLSLVTTLIATTICLFMFILWIRMSKNKDSFVNQLDVLGKLKAQQTQKINPLLSCSLLQTQKSECTAHWEFSRTSQDHGWVHEKIWWVLLPMLTHIEIVHWPSCFNESVTFFKIIAVHWDCTKVRNLLGFECLRSSHFVFDKSVWRMTNVIFFNNHKPAATESSPFEIIILQKHWRHQLNGWLTVICVKRTKTTLNSGHFGGEIGSHKPRSFVMNNNPKTEFGS